MKVRSLFTLLSLIIILTFTACKEKYSLTPEEAKQIAKEAYLYGFPMVVNYKTMYQYSIDKSSKEYKGEFNELSCVARVYSPEDKAIVTPNSDTPYCMFWVDLRTEPQIISLPDIEEERFYHFQLIDLYTHNFAYLGSLTTGNKAGKYLIAPLDWEGKKPEGVDSVLKCETDLFFVIVRTQLFNEDDLKNVAEIQNDYNLVGLSEFLGNEKKVAEDKTEYPEWNEGDQFTAESFKYIDFILKLVDTAEDEQPLLEKFKKINIGTDKPFNLSLFDEDIKNAIEEGVKEGFTEAEEFIAKYSSDPLISAKCFGTREFLNKSAKQNFQLADMFVLRTVAAHLGLYGNSGEEAVYPTYLAEAPGVPFDASKHKYTLTFEKNNLPPVNAFWSFTMYDGKTQLLVDNKLDRYLLNSTMLDNYVYGKDGSLTLYIQKDSPGKKLEANWLPAPNGPFYCILRLYGPKEEALKGEWVNPKLVKN